MSYAVSEVGLHKNTNGDLNLSCQNPFKVQKHSSVHYWSDTSGAVVRMKTAYTP